MLAAVNDLRDEMRSLTRRQRATPRTVDSDHYTPAVVRARLARVMNGGRLTTAEVLEHCAPAAPEVVMQELEALRASGDLFVVDERWTDIPF